MKVASKHPIRTGMKKYHHTLKDMKKLLGKTNVFGKDCKYFDEIFINLPENNCSCKDEGESEGSGCCVFTRMLPCPNIMDCQTFQQWKHYVAVNRFSRFLQGYKLRPVRLKLCILPIGPFPEFVLRYKSKTGQSLFELVAKYVGLFFTGSEVSVLDSIDINNLEVTKRENNFTKKTQYLVSDFFPILRSFLPKDAYSVIAITWDDVYPSKDLNFVLGQANFAQYSCVSTFGRFDPTYVIGFKGQESGIPLNKVKDLNEINTALLWKLLKVVTHETCHLFGLAHCSMFECLMNGSGSTKEALSQPMLLCPLCMNKLHYAFSNWSRASDCFKIQIHLAGIYQFLKYVILPICVDESDGNTKSRVENSLNFIEHFL